MHVARTQSGAYSAGNRGCDHSRIRAQTDAQHAKDPNQVVLVALENNHVIGFAELLQTPRSPIKRSEAAELASLYVLESCHRHGVGRALVEAGQRAIGNDRLALWVAGFNTNAQGFYRHIGFHETGLTQTEDMGPDLEMINYSDGVFQ